MNLLRMLLGVLIAVNLAGWVAAETPPARLGALVPVAEPDQSLFGEAVLFYSNAARRAHGLAALRLDPGLVRAAGEHARNMARLRTHSHVLPVRGQRDLSERVKRQSLRFRRAAENIARDKVFRLLGRPVSGARGGCRFTYADTGREVPRHTYASLAEQAVTRWLASANHRSSLLSESYTRVGAGVAADREAPACGDFYVVQDFAD